MSINGLENFNKTELPKDIPIHQTEFEGTKWSGFLLALVLCGLVFGVHYLTKEETPNPESMPSAAKFMGKPSIVIETSVHKKKLIEYTIGKYCVCTPKSGGILCSTDLEKDKKGYVYVHDFTGAPVDRPVDVVIICSR